MKAQNLKLAGNIQQAVTQEVSRISALFEDPAILGGGPNNPKNPHISHVSTDSRKQYIPQTAKHDQNPNRDKTTVST